MCKIYIPRVKNGYSFHHEKCDYMKIGRTSTEDQGYQMGKQLKITSEKDVGLIINDKLSCTDHLVEKVKKANELVGLIRRTFLALNAEILKALYI